MFLIIHISRMLWILRSPVRSVVLLFLRSPACILHAEVRQASAASRQSALNARAVQGFNQNPLLFSDSMHWSPFATSTAGINLTVLSALKERTMKRSASCSVKSQMRLSSANNCSPPLYELQYFVSLLSFESLELPNKGGPRIPIRFRSVNSFRCSYLRKTCFNKNSCTSVTCAPNGHRRCSAFAELFAAPSERMRPVFVGHFFRSNNWRRNYLQQWTE